uniref:RGS domain-containing protein n=1 Tax=Globisporangium ultimum (strain ATCC 200006 / CBS 805.95 / DAOM BR144) TaxID=431595 RepID=K3X585_GLOUD
MVTFVITCFLMVCLPLMRFAFECFASAIGERDDMIVFGHRVARATILQLIFAVVTIVVFTLPLPVLLMSMVYKNRPTGSLRNPNITYDEDGEQVAFDDKVYARLIATDPAQLNCPFRSLYAGFTSNWSLYKVYQLFFKVALIIPTVMASGTVCGIVTCSIYLLIATVPIVRAPFSDPLNNFMDRSGKIGALATCIGGLIVANIASSTSTKVVVTVVIVVNMVSLVTMIGILLFSLKPLRRVIKNWLGTLTFSDTVRDIRDGPSAKIIPAWDLDREIKHRVWQAFWKTMLLSFKNDQLIQRLHELEQAAGASGMQNIKRHWEGLQSEYVAQLRIATRTMLEGVDVFWNNPNTAHLNSQVCFGKMYVRPYPFHCVMVYDESERTAVIDDDKVSDFLFLNFSPAIVEKRLMRQKLRALSGRGVPIQFSFARKEVVRLEGIMITDSQGRSRRYNKGGNLELIFHYNKGVINVTNNSEDHAMADGFNVRMTYSDGLANVEIQNDPVSYRYTGRVAVMKHEHIGLTKEMHVSTQLKQILAQSEAQWVPGLEALYGEHAVYRQTLAQKHTQLSDVLAELFWYFVYSNPNVSRLELEDYLSTRERNPLMCELPRTHASALSFLYKRMEFVQSHRAAAFWFLFWDDVFARNGEMECLKPFRADFDPFEPTSICYRVMKREDLERWLEQRNLRPKWWCSVRSVLMGGRTLFHDKVLALLYDKLDNLISSVSEDAAPTEKLQKLQKGVNPVRRDTSKPLAPNDKVTPWAECHNVVANEK